MKVLLINHFPLEGSGSGTYTKNIALHLRKRGHEVCVIFPENRPVLMLPGIRMFPVMFSAGKASWSSLPFNFPCFTTHPQSRTTFADLSSGELAQYLTLFSSVLRQAVREFQPDVIHAQHAWCLSWLASLCDIPLVVTIHGTDLMGCRKWPVFRGFAEEAIAGSAKVLAISQDNRDLAISVLPSCANRLLLLPNGYNEDIFYPEEVDRESLFDSLGLPYRGETVCLLSKLNVKHHIEVEITMDELDLTAAESKATYDEIKAYVLEKFGFKVSQLYIAQIKRKCGIIERKNYNQSKKEDAKVPKCPPEKEAAIMDALKHFQMIP